MHTIYYTWPINRQVNVEVQGWYPCFLSLNLLLQIQTTDVFSFATTFRYVTGTALLHMLSKSLLTDAGQCELLASLLYEEQLNS